MSQLSHPTPSRTKIQWICVLFLATAACGQEPEVGSFQAKLAFDNTVRTFVERFDLAIIRSTTSDGAALTCGDIPHPFPFGHGQLRLVESRQVPWSGQQTEAKLPPLEVPAGQPLIIAVQGMAQWLGDAHAVARGCVEGAIYGPGENASVRVDVKATVGRSCEAATDCEPTLTICLQGEHFVGGYCTISGCITDDQCPKGSRCVTGGSGNICARSCLDSTGDCETTQYQSCEKRLGPSGCAQVCVNPHWSAGQGCGAN